MARTIFNDTTTKYISKVLVFPMSIVVAMFGFREPRSIQASKPISLTINLDIDEDGNDHFEQAW